MDKKHEQKVASLAARVTQFYENKVPFRIFHGSTNSTRTLTFKRDELLDTTSLDQILKIDTEAMTATVEPNVSMEQLVQSTLKHGLIPHVVMEFPGITVGGGIQGGGGESSSFKWGCFNQTCNWYEMILASGEVIRASREEHADLFYGTAGSSGTLGVITVAEVNLQPSKRYVRLHYEPVTSFADAKQVIEQTSQLPVEFIDGIMFAKNQGVIISGTLSDQVEGKCVRFRRARDQWYYLHVEESLAKHQEGWTETVPLTDYLFRYDRGAFWVGRFAFEMFDVPFNRLTRWLLDPILHTRKLYQALQESGAAQRHVVQDIILPARNVVQFLRDIDSSLGIYPLWLCPLLPDNESLFQLNHLNTDSIINVGLWGPELPSYKAFMAANKFVESKVLHLEGRKWSYAHSYFTPEQFWSMYNKKAYDALRKHYHATNLPSMYDKLTVTRQHPIDRKMAVWRAIAGLARLHIEP